MKYLLGGLLAVFLVLILVFSVQNMAAMEVSFLAWSMTLPKALVILGSYVLGGVSGYGLFHVLKLAIEKM